MKLFNREKIDDMVEVIKNFIFDNKIYVIIFVSFLTITFILLMIMLIIFSLKSKSNLKNTVENGKSAEDSLFIFTDSSVGNSKIDPNILRLLEEPLKLPPIQFSREQRKIWKKSEIDYWYKLPSSKSMEELNKKNKRVIDTILEAAP